MKTAHVHLKQGFFERVGVELQNEEYRDYSHSCKKNQKILLSMITNVVSFRKLQADLCDVRISMLPLPCRTDKGYQIIFTVD